MQHRSPLRRLAFLAVSLPAISLLTGTAEAAAPLKLSDAAGVFLVARLAAMENDLPYAAAQFDRVLAADPADAELRQQAFMANLLAGRQAAAARLAALQPAGNQVAQMVLADADARAGNWAAAARRFAALPRQGMTLVLQPLLLAWAQQGAGDTDAALATLQPFVAGRRFRGAYALHAALIADQAGRAAEATKLYQVALAASGGLNLQIGRQIASWQARAGDAAAARATLDRMVQTSPDATIALPALQAGVAAPQLRDATDGMAEAYLALAAALRPESAGQFSLILLRLALDMRPDFTAARLLVADILEGRGQPEAALAALAPIPAADPLDALVRLRQAVLTDNAGHADAALALLAQVAKDYPTRPDALAIEGDILRAQQHFPQAVTAYDQAVARLGTPQPVNWPLFYDRGVAEERAGRWPQAKADFLKALKLSPDQPAVLNYLGYSWAEKGRHLTRARAMIERAAELRPNNGAILDSLGWVVLRQGDVASAIRFLERATELASEDSTINAHLGDAYYAAGRKREARFQWLRALNLKPEPKDAAVLRIKLRDDGDRPAHPVDEQKTL